jgi:hypothetical protein
MMAKRKTRRLAKALLETVAEMRKSGLLGKATYERIRLRHLDVGIVPATEPSQRNC